MRGALGRLFAVAEAYPQLRASENFQQLQEELSDTEDKIAAARRYYNNVVRRFNTAQQTLPTSLLAGPLGFRPREFFELEDEGDRAPGPGRAVTLQEQIRSNRIRTGVVLLGFAVLALAFVAVIAGAYDPGIAGVVGVVAIVYGLFSWFAAGG